MPCATCPVQALESHWHVIPLNECESAHLHECSGMYDGTLGVIGAIEALAALKVSVSDLAAGRALGLLF